MEQNDKLYFITPNLWQFWLSQRINKTFNSIKL